MKNFITAILAMAISVAAIAQTKETRPLDSFNKLSVGNSIQLTMEKGNENSARIETSGVDVDRVLTKVSGSGLSIFMKNGNYRSIKVKVFLTYTESLESIKASNSSSINALSLIESEELFVQASNSAKIEMTAETKELEIQVMNSGKVNLEANTETLDVNVMNSGKLNLSGRTNSQRFKVMNSGQFMAYGMKSERADANISSSGKAEIWVSKELVADAMNSGRISYKGNPEKVLVDSSNSGKVSKAN